MTGLTAKCLWLRWILAFLLGLVPATEGAAMATRATDPLTWSSRLNGTGARLAHYEEGQTADRHQANTHKEDPSGLINDGYRYRDPFTSTNLSSDPAGFVDGPDVYAYVRQNPWRAFDPRGLARKDADGYTWKSKGHLASKVMKIKFVSESKIDGLADGPFDVFEDDGGEAARWQTLREHVRHYLSRFSHEEDDEGSPESPGFLLQDDHDNTKTIGLEFNDAGLIDRSIVIGLAEILNRTASDFQMSITIFVGEEMYYLILAKGKIYVPKLKVLQARFVE